MLRDFFEENLEEISNISDQIFDNPELGYKEFATKKIIIDYIKGIDESIVIKEHTITGLTINVNDGGRVIGLVTELDAVYAPNHFKSACDGAAHNCGHFSQVAIALVLFKYLYLNQDNYRNTFSFVFTPAEEFLDLEYRKSLIDDGTISSYSGKIEMILNGEFEHLDLAIGWHSMEDCDFEFDINGGLAGFTYLDYQFIGKTAHAGVNPEVGLNSLDAAVKLYNYLRELESKYTLEQVRINPNLEADQQLNIVSSKATLKTYIRYRDINVVNEVVDLVNKFVSDNLSEYEIITDHNPGYFPLVQSKSINDIFIDTIKDDYKYREDDFLFAGGDFGDLSYIIPCIQIGYAGFTGNVHGDQFKLTNYEFVYVDFPTKLIEFINKLDDQVQQMELYQKNTKEYKENKYWGL